MNAMNDTRIEVLIIDDEKLPRDLLKSAFSGSKDGKFEVILAKNESAADNALRRTKFDVVVIDLLLKTDEPESGLHLLEEGMIFATCPDAVKIVITGYPTYERCVKAMRLGAWDFIIKTGDYPERVVRSVVTRLAERENMRREEQQVYEKWLPANERLMQEKFPNEFVAVCDGTVIAHDKSLIALGTAMSAGIMKKGQRPVILHVEKGVSHGEH